MLTPAHPDILPGGADALSNAPAPADPAPDASDTPPFVGDTPNTGHVGPGEGSDPRPDPRPARMFNSFQFHLPRPSGRDVALLALLDKFPDYDAMHSAGEQSQWFRYFESFARLALTGHDHEQA